MGQDRHRQRGAGQGASEGNPGLITGADKVIVAPRRGGRLRRNRYDVVVEPGPNIRINRLLKGAGFG